jgi:hypothetical protein
MGHKEAGIGVDGFLAIAEAIRYNHFVEFNVARH